MKQLMIVLFRSYGQRSLTAVGLAVLTVVLLVAAAQAHALLIKSEPKNDSVLEQTPDQISAWFSHELETKLSSMQVFDPKGNQVDRGDGSVDLNDSDHASMLVSLPESLPNGPYTVRWTAVSADDGDTTEGEFSFDVTHSRAPAGQSLETDHLPAGDERAIPFGELIVAFGFLLVIVIALTHYSRLARGR
ncbi:MAG: copper resistance protein CopC [Anaerolineae bacterium]|nr:copper resistance protein CopC [Anaerolineae bacterium]MCB9101116.1 copper resistance protein CopC [Anaerolineales bacterium]